MSSKLVGAGAVWILERSIEALLLGWLAYVLLGPTNVPGWNGVAGNVLRNAGLAVYCFIASGYVLTTAWFGIMRRGGYVIPQHIIAVGLFLAHSSMFLHSLSGNKLWPLLVIGGCIVCTASVAGMGLFALITTKR